MIDTQRGSSFAGFRHPGCVLAGATMLLATFGGVASADPVKFPQIQPVIAMDVPSGWNVDNRSDGVDLKSPEKNAIIVAGIVYREKSQIDAWAKMATGKLEAFGVAFDKNAKAPPKVAAPAKPDVAPVSGSSAFTTDPNAFTFAGKPSLSMPGNKDSNDPVAPAETSVESLTHFGTTFNDPGSKLPFKAVQYYGTTLNGKPVDVQLVVYSLPDKRFFVMMQESGPNDDRTVAIAKSLRPIE